MSYNVEIKPSSPVDVLGLIERSSFKNVRGSIESLRSHILMSEDSWVAKLNGTTVVCWGVIPPSVLSTKAYVWLVAADDIGKDPHVKFLFVRYTQRILEIMLQKYDSLYGFCYPNDAPTVKWLRLLGAKFGEPHEGKMPFSVRRMLK